MSQARARRHAAQAAEGLPPHIAGTWSTLASMNVFNPGDRVIMLQPDGSAMVVATR